MLISRKPLSNTSVKQKFFIILLAMFGVLSGIGCVRSGKDDNKSESKGFIGDIFKRMQTCDRDMEIQGELVTSCKWNGRSFKWQSERRLATQTEAVLRDLLVQVGLQDDANDLHVIALPKRASPEFNMILSYKWHSEKSKYVNLIQLIPQFESLKDPHSSDRERCRLVPGFVRWP